MCNRNRYVINMTCFLFQNRPSYGNRSWYAFNSFENPVGQIEKSFDVNEIVGMFTNLNCKTSLKCWTSHYVTVSTD